MRIPTLPARNPEQAWRIALLTVIVIVVGCSRSKSPDALPEPNAAAARNRDAVQRDVDKLQSKVDRLAAEVTKHETELKSFQAERAAQTAKAEPDKQLVDSLDIQIAESERLIADQKADLAMLREELTKRNLELQAAQKAANAIRNDPDAY